MVFNPTTRLYVLFYNYVRKAGYDGGVGNGLGVATSRRPAGPVQSKIRAPLFTALALNATGQSRVTLSLR